MFCGSVNFFRKIHADVAYGFLRRLRVEISFGNVIDLRAAAFAELYAIYIACGGGVAEFTNAFLFLEVSRIKRGGDAYRIVFSACVIRTGGGVFAINRICVYRAVNNAVIEKMGGSVYIFDALEYKTVRRSFALLKPLCFNAFACRMH